MSETDAQTALDEVPPTLDDMASADTPLAKVFPDGFVQEYTEFDSVQELFEQGSWSVSTFGDLDAIPAAELDDIVTDNSTFDSWAGMAQAAGDEYAHRSGAY